jgi:chemotaxis signal transduction protein
MSVLFTRGRPGRCKINIDQHHRQEGRELEGKNELQDTEHLVVMLSKQLYGLPYYDLVQIIDSPKATVLPHMDDHVRGTIDFQGEIIVLYDMRKILGLPSLADEISATVRSLADRKRDHINWIEKLKDEVYHDREITVQTDPHKCAFGKWYDQFITDSIRLEEYMSRFDAPHKNIHTLAIKAQELIRLGRKQQAKDLIHDAERLELNALIRLFDGAEHYIRTYTYEYAVVLEHAGRRFAISADSVRSFGRIDEISQHIPPIIKESCGEFLKAFGRMRTDEKDEDVLILDASRIANASELPRGPATP